LLELAPYGWLVTPSYPGETSALLEVDSAVAAGRRLRELGVENVAVTCGARGVQLHGPGVETWVEAVPAPSVVDQTGAGDAYVGTLTARLVQGDDVTWAAWQAAAAASLVVGAQGGTGHVPPLEETRAHLANAREAVG
jgi:2-dehydro-3-deoxygluconokinase